MAGRSGRRRVNSSSPLVDLDVVFADDEWLDGIATRPWTPRPTLSMVGAPERFRTERLSAEYASGTLLTRDPLTELFENWRDELSLAPLPEPPRLGDLGRVAEPPKVPAKRSLRPALAIAAAIAALLVGTASISSKDATPNSALWPVADRVLAEPGRIGRVGRPGRTGNWIWRGPPSQRVARRRPSSRCSGRPRNSARSRTWTAGTGSGRRSPPCGRPSRPPPSNRPTSPGRRLRADLSQTRP